MCFAKSKMQARNRQEGFEANKFSMLKMSFVEFQELTCRLARATFALDLKTASSTKNPAIEKIAQLSQRHIAVQIAVFLDIWLANLVPEKQVSEFRTRMPELEDVLFDINE